MSFHLETALPKVHFLHPALALLLRSSLYSSILGINEIYAALPTLFFNTGTKYSSGLHKVEKQ